MHSSLLDKQPIITILFASEQDSVPTVSNRPPVVNDSTQALITSLIKQPNDAEEMGSL